MGCCPALPIVNGVPGGSSSGGGGGAERFGPASFDIVGALTTVVPLASLIPNGAVAVLEGLWIAAREVAPGTATFGQSSYVGAIQAQTNAADGTVLYGSPPWGPPPAAAQSTGYVVPLAFGSPGGIAINVQVTGSQLELTATGIAGTTIRFTYAGNIWVLDGAVRLI